MIKIRNIFCNSFTKNVQFGLRTIQTSAVRFSTKIEGKEEPKKLPLDEVSQKLMSFFDLEENWKKMDVLSGEFVFIFYFQQLLIFIVLRKSMETG